MKMIKSLFKRDEELSSEDKNKINSIVENKDKPTDEPQNEEINLTEFVTHLNLEQVNQLRDLLDRREDELHELYGLKSEGAKAKKEYNGTINVEEPVHDEDLDKETYKDEQKNYKEQIKNIEDSVVEEVEESQDEGYIELDENVKVEDLQDKDLKKDLENTAEDVYLKLAKIFGEENLFKEVKKNLHENLPKDKNILCIGIRKEDSFNKEEDSLQNSWFIQNIKQLEELSHFKMLSSSPTSKELFWDRENLPVLISFKTTSKLKTKDEFIF